MNEVKIRPEDMVTRVLGSLSNIINPPVKESDRQGTTTIRTLSLLHCYHIRPLVSSSVVGLVLYVHHPPLSSERSDRRPSAVGSGVRKEPAEAIGGGMARTPRIHPAYRSYFLGSPLSCHLLPSLPSGFVILPLSVPFLRIGLYAFGSVPSPPEGTRS